MTEITLSPVVSTLLGRKELERNKLVEFANGTFAEAIAVALKDAGVPDGAEFNLASTDDGLVKVTYKVPEPAAEDAPEMAQQLVTDAEGAE